MLITNRQGTQYLASINFIKLIHKSVKTNVDSLAEMLLLSSHSNHSHHLQAVLWRFKVGHEPSLSAGAMILLYQTAYDSFILKEAQHMQISDGL